MSKAEKRTKVAADAEAVRELGRQAAELSLSALRLARLAEAVQARAFRAVAA